LLFVPPGCSGFDLQATLKMSKTIVTRWMRGGNLFAQNCEDFRDFSGIHANITSIVKILHCCPVIPS
jgi:hypothetical protein